MLWPGGRAKMIYRDLESSVEIEICDDDLLLLMLQLQLNRLLMTWD